MLRRWWRRRSSPEHAREGRPASVPDAVEDRGAGVGGGVVRTGDEIELRRHVPQNREAFQRWYADREIAELLRHDQEPLSAIQSRGYFDTFILPLSARGMCWAIHERVNGRLLGTTAVTDISERRGVGRSALFRIVIGEKDAWGRGLGTEATRLAMEEAFDELGLDEVRLEVFKHNPRAIAAYRRVGFEPVAEHVEWVSRRRTELQVLEMALSADAFWDLVDDEDDEWDSSDGDDPVMDASVELYEEADSMEGFPGGTGGERPT
jgi:RimJ/RimL family protein N-acetyltransferase